MTDGVSFSDLKRELLTFLDYYRAWVKPLNDYTERNLLRINRDDGYTFARFEQELTALRTSLVDRDDPFPRFNAIMDAVCQLYRSADAPSRRMIREFVAGHRELADLVRGFAGQTAAAFTPENVNDRLPVALSALSIENCAVDFRDTILALADVWVLAAQAGVKPVTYFEEVARLSDDSVAPGGTVPMSRLLREFHRHPALQERQQRYREERRNPAE